MKRLVEIGPGVGMRYVLRPNLMNLYKNSRAILFNETFGKSDKKLESVISSVGVHKEFVLPAARHLFVLALAQSSLQGGQAHVQCSVVQ